LEATQKSYEEINSYDKKRREDEIKFLKLQSKNLESFMKGFDAGIQ
jgi:hypothetical protein